MLSKSVLKDVNKILEIFFGKVYGVLVQGLKLLGNK